MCCSSYGVLVYMSNRSVVDRDILRKLNSIQTTLTLHYAAHNRQLRLRYSNCQQHTLLTVFT